MTNIQQKRRLDTDEMNVMRVLIDTGVSAKYLDNATIRTSIKEMLQEATLSHSVGDVEFSGYFTGVIYSQILRDMDKHNINTAIGVVEYAFEKKVTDITILSALGEMMVLSELSKQPPMSTIVTIMGLIVVRSMMQNMSNIMEIKASIQRYRESHNIDDLKYNIFEEEI